MGNLKEQRKKKTRKGGWIYIIVRAVTLVSRREDPIVGRPRARARSQVLPLLARKIISYCDRVRSGGRSLASFLGLPDDGHTMTTMPRRIVTTRIEVARARALTHKQLVVSNL